MRAYLGMRTPDGCVVLVVENCTPGPPLDPRNDLYNHSPTGLEWGYRGSGPAQLALALVADATGDDQMALAVYQDFKAAVVARFPKSGWFITRQDVLGAVAEVC